MALTLALSLVDPTAVAGRAATFMVTVSNTSASAVTLQSLQVAEQTESDATISQPNFLTPQAALELGNPTISGSSSVSYTFKVVFQSPNYPGPQPNAPQGATGVLLGQPGDSVFTLLATASASDGSVGSTVISVPVLSLIAPFPQAQGGALQYQQGLNIINGIIMGVL
jgi:hypothetical protein